MCMESLVWLTIFSMVNMAKGGYSTSVAHPTGLGSDSRRSKLNGFGIKKIKKIGWGFPYCDFGQNIVSFLCIFNYFINNVSTGTLYLGWCTSDATFSLDGARVLGKRKYLLEV